MCIQCKDKSVESGSPGGHGREVGAFSLATACVWSPDVAAVARGLVAGGKVLNIVNLQHKRF